mmetsp:Transcript_4494/g.6945  ORF Transcript_4494/g.6945 Transcript_4494/m.6945 type:complete len:329 (-) Transcript_4494:1420-2406(-)
MEANFEAHKTYKNRAKDRTMFVHCSNEHLIWCQSDLLRLVSSYLSVVDLLTLEKTCHFFHQRLSASDVDGLWKQLEEMTIIDQKIDSMEHSKTHLVLFQKAKIFAETYGKSKPVSNGMGSDVVHELFHGSKESRKEDKPKSGYYIFVRVTNANSDQVMYQGFVEELFAADMEHLMENVPIEQQHLQLVLGMSFLMSEEFLRLAKSLRRVGGFFALEAMKEYVNSLHATVVVVHETLPCRLVCCAGGFPDSPLRSTRIRFVGMPKPTASYYFPTQLRLRKNESFLLNGKECQLSCQFGCFTFGADEGNGNSPGHILTCPTIALSFATLL